MFKFSAVATLPLLFLGGSAAMSASVSAAPPSDPPAVGTTEPVVPLPIGVGAEGPAVAAIQGRLGITVDCDYGDQTRRAVEEWQTTAGIAVTGNVDEAAWALLAVPTTWGADADANGTIDPAEVTLVCDGDVELPPPPVDTTGWPDTMLALVAEVCSIPDEFVHPDDDSPDFRYSPTDDSITIFGAGAEDYPERGEEVFQTLACVLGMSGVPDRVISQISSTRALDGMQSAEWDEFGAQWTYHPDAGLNLTIWSQ
jgi:hypothetical protein